jgi:hypothetical protein
MARVLGDLADLPVGAHAVSFYSDRREAADQAMRFLAGTPSGTSASYWVVDPGTAAAYNERLAEVAPEQVGCVVALGHEQVERSSDGLRPSLEIREFLARHPEGVTAAGDTLSRYWGPTNVPDHLEYERWFDDQPRETSRFLCPYDLRTVPPEMAPAVLGELGRHHSHVVLSSSPAAAVRLLQLFVFETPGQLPPALSDDLRWAFGEGLVAPSAADEPLRLTPAGSAAVQEWAGRTPVDG